jgi:hypothetical protein
MSASASCREVFSGRQCFFPMTCAKHSGRVTTSLEHGTDAPHLPGKYQG